jgi:hypothetical protein
MADRKDVAWLQELAARRGGKCLSTEYKNNSTKYQWECSERHRWDARANGIQQGRWCPICTDQSHNLQWLRDLAAKRRGHCLSAEYFGMNSKHQWECSKGDRWEASASSIQQGNWCPHCAGNAPRNLQWLQELAEEKEGRCLSIEYFGMAKKYQWECSKGDRWEASANNIQQGKWCPACYGNVPYNLEWVQSLATKKSGKCLSIKYLGIDFKYRWQCSKGDIWDARASHVQQGSWCPICVQRQSRDEIELRGFVRRHYPDTHNEPGRNLLANRNFELDIYVPSLRKAIEFDGWFWHHSPWAIKRGAEERDSRKDLQCQEAGIRLLRIQERDYVKDPESIQQQVLNFLRSP